MIAGFRSARASAWRIALVLVLPAGALPSMARADEIPPPPSQQRCDALRAHRELPAIVSYDPAPGALRVFAMQYKQDLANVTTYASFRTKIECLIRSYVLPHRAARRPNLVAFNETVGVATIATGSRGAAARRAFAQPESPSCESQGVPCATLAGLESIGAAYAPQISAYQARFGGAVPPIAAPFVGATDTFVRGWMKTFSDMAKRYDIYIAGSNLQTAFTQSTDPIDIQTFADPDYPRPPSVYVATSPEVYNEAFMWGPRNVRSTGPDVLRNVVASNRKVPLTQLEQEIGVTPGPSTGSAAIENLRPYRMPGTPARIGFATSLPAFIYGSPPPGTSPCSDTSIYYMRCLDVLGANVVLQDEANDGRWAADNGAGIWQPLDWMGSTYRAVTDPTVHFAYDVNPMMTGNLADLPFDGQSAITQRGLVGGSGCHYVGDASAQSGDPSNERSYAGEKPQFLALAPWVTHDATRAQLEATAAKLAPGSGDPLMNDYLETAIVADLPFPPDPHRAGCATSSSHAPAPARHPRSRCLRAGLITIALSRGIRVRSVTAFVNGRPRARLRGPRSYVRLSLRGVPPGEVDVLLVVRTRDGRVLRIRRSYRTCVPRGKPHGPGPHSSASTSRAARSPERTAPSMYPFQ